MFLTYDQATLKGRTVRAFSMLGKPCVGARYLGAGDSHVLDPEARCVVCGRLACNAHHEPPKGMGGGLFRMDTPKGQIALRPPLLAVCGFGNTLGCHGQLHAHCVKVRWGWDKEIYERHWLEGRFRPEWYRNDPVLFAMGRYVIDFNGCEKEVRP